MRTFSAFVCFFVSLVCAAPLSAQAPTITSFTPATIGRGLFVTINGTNFNGVTAVQFNGVSASSYTVSSPAQIVAKVPSSTLTNGAISVTTPSGTATSPGSFSFTNVPIITGVTPMTGPQKTYVYITGANFQFDSHTLRFNGVVSNYPRSWNDDHIRCIVPVGATSGPITVENTHGTATSPASFTVASGPPPANDSFSNATVISGAAGSVSGTTVNATKETVEPSHADDNGGSSVWYRWTAPTTGVFAFMASSSGFAKLVDVYTGSAVNALTRVARVVRPADAYQGTTSAAFNAVAGTTYSIAVDGYTGYNLDFTLSWYQGPAITTQPTDQVAAIGGSATFTVAATGGSLGYRWYRNDIVISGSSATGPSLTLTNLQSSDAGQYHVVVYNAAGVATSNVVRLLGTNSPPTITAAPQAVTATAGNPVTLSVTATGSGVLSYQWRRNGVPIAGATAASYTVPAVSLTDADLYDVFVYDGLAWSLPASPARLTVVPASYAQAITFDPAKPANFETDYVTIYRLWPLADGRFYAAGDFVSVNGEKRTGLVRFNANGTVDATFAPVAFSDSSYYLRDLVVQTDGKVIIGGYFYNLGSPSRSNLARLNADGSVDSTFVTRGMNSNVMALALQPDGRVVVGGYFYAYLDAAYAETPRAGLARLNADGSLDPTFNPGVSGGTTPYALAVQADGKILVGGSFSSVAGQSRNCLARLNPDGTLDSTFATGSGTNNTVQAIRVQPDGKILLGGSFNSYNGTAAVRIARLESSGALDAAFMTGTGFTYDVNALALQADGKILVGGYFTAYNGTTRAYLARLGASGALDTTFAPVIGSGGTITALAVAADGRILLGGSNSGFTVNGTARSGVARLSSDGTTLDPTVASEFRGDGYVYASLLLPGGKVLAGGNFSHVNGVPMTGRNLVRFLPDGTVDATFNPGTGPSSTVYAFLPQVDGRVIVAGNFTSYNGTSKRYVARITADGALDNTFPFGGSAAAPNSSVYALGAARGGRIVLGGTFSAVGSVARGGVARLEANGSVDVTFDSGAGAYNASGSYAYVRSLAVAADGKTYVGGWFDTFAGQPRGCLARLNADGSLDLGFANPALSSDVRTLAVQPDGKVIAGGYFTGNLARFNLDGTRDTTFASGGANGSVHAMTLQPDGRLIVGGFLSGVVARFNSDGTRDPSLVTSGLGGGVYTVALRDNGQLFVAGRYGLGGAFTTSAGGGGTEVIAVSNVGQPVQTNLAVGKQASGGYDFSLAASFTTGGTTSVLSKVTLVLANVGGAPSGLTVALYTGLGASGPTGLVTALNGNTAPTTPGPYAYTPAATTTLAAGTTYWIVISAPATPLETMFRFSNTASTAEDMSGLTGWSIGDYRMLSNNGGSTWMTSSTSVPLFSVHAIPSNPPPLNLDSWATRTTPVTNDLNAIVWGDRQFVAVGDSGAIVTSGDRGQTWAARTSGTSNYLYGVARSESLYVAVGSGGTLRTSVDGVTWTSRTSGTTSSLYNVAWSGSKFVAVGSGGSILTSTSGATWSIQASGTTASLNDVVWTGTQFVASGISGTILTSPDGIEWTSRSSGTTNSIYGIGAGSGKIVAVGSAGLVLTSTDGVSWTSRTSGVATALYDVGWTGGQFVAVGWSGVILTSGDGTSWTVRSSGTTNSLNSVAWNGSQLVVVGNLGTVLTTGDMPPPVSPVLLTAPVARTVNAGNTATFSVAVTGTAPFTYQWRKDSVPVAGATSASYSISNAQAEHVGSYDVVITNSAGSITTAAVALAVTPMAPWISTQPVARSMAIGSTVYFSVVGSGTAPITYQWRKDGVNLAGATSSQLVLQNIQVANAGTYDVVLSNSLGTTTSDGAGLTPTPDPVYTFSTFAGTADVVGGDDGAGSGARFNGPSRGVFDSAGNLYVTDRYNHTIRRITPAGVVTTFAGLAGTSGSTDGIGSAARFENPVGIAIDSAGTLYVADSGNQTVRKITPAAVVSTFAGLAGVVGSADGVGSVARFGMPWDLAIDPAGTLYVADYNNDTVRKISPAGVVTTVAGLAGANGSVDGVGSSARFSAPNGMVVGPAGELYVSDETNHVIRMISPGGVVGTIAGWSGLAGGADGLGRAARFRNPTGMTRDAGGNLYIADFNNHALRKLAPNGMVSTVAGLPGTSGTADGSGSAARFDNLNGVVFDSSGNLYVMDRDNHTIRKGVPSFISTAPTITTQPLAQTVTAGQPATFSVTASGTGTLTYQWRRNGVAISGATNATYTVASASRTHADHYDVVVSSGPSATISNSVRLGVAPSSYPTHVAVDAARQNVFDNDGASIERVWPLADGRFYAAGRFVTVNEGARPLLARFNADGTLDTSFASNVLPRRDDNVSALAVQADGKILVGGYIYLNEPHWRSALIRLNADGTLDATFATRGVSGGVNAIAVQPDGRILIGGWFWDYIDANGNYISRRHLARLNADGTLDAGFNPDTVNDSVNALAIQPDGKIVVGGVYGGIGGATSTLARLHPTGALDSTLATGSGPNSSVFAIRVQADGGILIGGRFTSYNGTSAGRIARLTATGALDTSFATGSGLGSDVNDLAVQSDGKVIVGGSFSSFDGRSVNYGFVRLTSAGGLDNTFTPALIGPARTVAIAADGKILLGGYSFYGGSASRQGVMRLNADGSLDTAVSATFRSAGYVSASVLLPGGKIMIGGWFTHRNGTPLNGRNLARFNADGTFDTTFNPGAGTDGGVTAMLVQPSGHVIIGGWFNYYNGTPKRFLARITADGALDPAFPAGNVDLNFGVNRIAAAPGGRLIIAGDFTSVGDVPRPGVARLHADGSLDSTFNPGADLAPNSYSQALAVATDGQVYLDAYVPTLEGGIRRAFMRLNPDGRRDTSFAPALGDYPNVYGIALQPDGKLILGGWFTIDGVNRTLVRLHPSGARDTTFDASNANLNSSVTRVLLQEDGKMIIGGYISGSFVRLNADGTRDTTFSVTGLNPSDYVSTVTLTDSGQLFIAGGYGIGATLTVPAATPPVFATHPQDQTVAVGGSITFTAVANGDPAPTYRWQTQEPGTTDWPYIADSTQFWGTNTATLTVFANHSGLNGWKFRAVATNSAGTVASNGALLNVTGTSGTLINLSAMANAGTGAATLGAAFRVEGNLPKKVMVRAIGPTLANFGMTGVAADPALEIFNANTGETVAANNDWSLAANASQVQTTAALVGAFALPGGSKDAVVLGSFAPGTYRIRVNGAGGTVLLEIYDVDLNPRLVYFATRAQVGTGSTGFVLSYLAPGRSYLLRAIGPSLGIPAAVADPQLTLYSGSTVLATNDDWGGATAIADAGAIAGAMPLSATSKDAALLFTPSAAGPFTATISAAGGTSGVALLEIFELDDQRAAQIPVAVVSPPENITVLAGQPASFGVVVLAKPAPTYQWRKDSTPISGATQSTFAIGSVQATDAGTYDVVVTNSSGAVTTRPRTLTLTSAGQNTATHLLLGSGYAAGGTVTITNTLTYAGEAGGLGWSVALPPGWSYVSSAGAAGDIKPASGQTGTIEWAWTAIPPSPVTFSYTVRVPTGETGSTRTLAASAIVRPSGGGVITLPVTPNPLSLSLTVAHDADTNRDLHLNLFELTRVIELYNTRKGTQRTGAYRVQAGTEDGFGADAMREPGSVVVLERFHSADTAYGKARDGRIDLDELLRVILLYNHRAGTVRTGQYHVDPNNTEDGFGLGP